MRLTPELIALDQTPTDKMAAIAQAAALLVEADCVEESFRYGMIAREATSNSYLDRGIALPRGMAQSERHILESGMALIRTAQDIPWGAAAEPVNLIIAIAAPDDEYHRALQHIATLIQHDEQLDKLKNTTDPQILITLLTSPVDMENMPPSEIFPLYQQGIVYPHADGLHLLSATRLSEQAQALDAGLRIHAPDGRSADATDIKALVALAITHGQAITISGDSQSAVDALIEHISSNSVTPEEALPPAASSASKLLWYFAGAALLFFLVIYLTLK